MALTCTVRVSCSKWLVLHASQPSLRSLHTLGRGEVGKTSSLPLHGSSEEKQSSLASAPPETFSHKKCCPIGSRHAPAKPCDVPCLCGHTAGARFLVRHPCRLHCPCSTACLALHALLRLFSVIALRSHHPVLAPLYRSSPCKHPRHSVTCHPHEDLNSFDYLWREGRLLKLHHHSNLRPP